MISDYLCPADLNVGDRFCEDTYPEVWEVTKRTFSFGHIGVLAVCIGYIDPRCVTGRVGEVANWFGNVCLFKTDNVYEPYEPDDDLDLYYQDCQYGLSELEKNYEDFCDDATKVYSFRFKDEADAPIPLLSESPPAPDFMDDDDDMPSQIDFSGGIRGRFWDIKEKLKGKKQSIYSKAVEINNKKEVVCHNLTCCKTNGCPSEKLSNAQIIWNLYQKSEEDGKPVWDLLRTYWALTHV